MKPMHLVCPSCGHTAKFRVTCTTKAELDGGELLPLDGKLEIDDDGLCDCSECDYTAPLPEFQTGGAPSLHDDDGAVMGHVPETE